jgi:large subunit ribosomal protein L4
LIVAAASDENLLLSARNLQSVKVLTPENLNIYDLLGHEHLALTRESAQKIAEIYR